MLRSVAIANTAMKIAMASVGMGRRNLIGFEGVTTRKLYFISLGVYAASFALPAVIEPYPTPSSDWVDTWGWEAALMSVELPVVLVVGPSNVAYLAAALFIAIGSYQAAMACSVASLLSMAYCGIALPRHSGGGPIDWPAGYLGPGYYVWLAAGIMMLVCGVRTWRQTRNVRPSTLGLTDEADHLAAKQ
jgi:hypothetical protein